MSDPTETWRAPVAVQVKAIVSAAIGVVVAAVFFPLPIAIGVSVLLAAWGLGMGARRPAVTVDPGRGVLTVTMGFLTRRIPLADIAVVQLEGTKVTFGQTDGTAVSVHAWRRGRIDRWLRVPDIAADIAHAISKAADAARPGDEPAPGTRSSPTRADKAGTAAVARTRSGRDLPLVVMAVAGAIEVAAVFFVRVSWSSPAMTALGVVVALGFGFTGVFTLVFSLWTYLMSRPGRPGRPGRSGAARVRG